MDKTTHPRAKGSCDPGWAEEAVAIFNAVLARHGVTLTEVHEALVQHGLDITYKALSTKVNRGTFPFAFFLEAMDAIGVNAVRLSDKVDEEPRRKPKSEST
jgi:DNA (cytosine-5)-methyltransferase 1